MSEQKPTIEEMRAWLEHEIKWRSADIQHNINSVYKADKYKAKDLTREMEMLTAIRDHLTAPSSSGPKEWPIANNHFLECKDCTRKYEKWCSYVEGPRPDCDRKQYLEGRLASTSDFRPSVTMGEIKKFFTYNNDDPEALADFLRAKGVKVEEE